MFISLMALKQRFDRVMLTPSVRMHAGSETDPSDTINEIIFSTRKVRVLHYRDLCAVRMSGISPEAACHLCAAQDAHVLVAW